MRASVIIVSYNSQRDLGRCLPALLPSLSRQDEVIVVDNGSIDGSANWLAQAYPHVRLLCSRVNLGFASGNNLGARHAHGRYLAFLNPDTTVEPGWLEALMAALEADPKVGMVTSKILLLNDPQHINTCGNEVHISGITLCRGMGSPSIAFSEREEVSAVSGAAFAMRRDLFASLGGFDETFFMYMEDTDLSLRTRLVGLSILYVPSSIVYHDYRQTFGSNKTYYLERNRYRLILKNLRWKTLLLMAPALLLTELITWGYALVHGPAHIAAKLRAWIWLVSHLHEVLASRKAQPPHRVRDLDLLRRCSHRLSFGLAGDGWLARIAQAVFSPIYFLFFKILLYVVRW